MKAIIVFLGCYFVKCLSAIAATDSTCDERIKSLQAQVQEQGTKFAHLLASHESKFEILDKQLEEHQQIIAELRKENAHFEHMQHGKRPEENVENRLRSLRTLETDPIAFHATIKRESRVDHIGINQKIVFPDVLLNTGGGYHNEHGLFIAPKSGIYLFSVSIMASWSGSHHWIGVHLIKNGNVLANVLGCGANGESDQGSVTVVTQLVVGDEVWVSLYTPSDTSLWGDSYDSFMGLLVHET